MALRVWLPLNGNLENKGASSGTVTTTITNAWNDNGKIGKCALSSIQASYTFSELTNVTNFSIAYWIYIDSSIARHDWADIWAVNSVVGSTNATIRDEFTNVNGNHQLIIGKDTTVGSNTNNYAGLGLSATSAKDKWIHVALVKDNSTAKVYIDGTLVNTVNNSVFESSPQKLTGVVIIGSTTSTAAKINDFRIYDHCLSKLEVKEIAQGLVLHYKLDGFNGGAKKNYLGNSFPHLPNEVNEIVMSQNGGWAYSRSPSSAVSLMTENLEKGYFELVFSANRNNTTSSLIWLTKNWKFSGYERFENDISIWNDIKVNDVLTFSAEIKGSDPYQILAFFNLDGTKYNFIENLSIQENYGSWREIQGSLTITQQIYDLIFSSDLTRFAFTLQVSPILNVTPIDKEVPIYVRKLMLEKGNVANSWVPYEGDFSKDTTKIVDSSGYGNDGILANTTVDSNAKRYISSINFNGSNTYINAGAGAKVKDAITVAWWGYMDSWANYTRGISCTEGGGWTFEKNGNYIRFAFGTGTSSNTYKYATGTTTIANIGSGWHHFVGTFDGLNSAFYFDGAQQYSQATFTTKTPLYYHASNSIIIGAEAAGGAVPAGNYFNGKISDVRIYATALSADDVLALYKASAQIDNSKVFHTFELIENNDKSVRKNGVTEVLNISEFDALAYLKYDPNLHIEPDGSVWVHIYHHNHPDLGSFASTDTFAASVKKDENRWFNGTQVCNQLNKWEFLIKYAFTEGGIEYKERWIQTKNPESAVFGDVDAADITRITGGDYKTGTWGGLYKKNSSAYWAMNNGNSGNWFGATGSFSIYQGGIPGYGGGTITKTGYNDLYVRIDNVLSIVSTNSRITKNGILIGSNFIEK